MQIINVLRDHRRSLSEPVKCGKREMPASRFCQRKLLVHCKAPAPGFVSHFAAGDKLIEWNRPVFRPDSARRTEVRNATLGGNSGAGEWSNRPSAFEEPLERVDGSLQILRDHVCWSLLFSCQAMQRGHTNAIPPYHAARAQSRRCAGLLLQQARAQGGAAPCRREEPIHPRLPGSTRR